MFFDFWKKPETTPQQNKTWEADFTDIHFWSKPAKNLINHLEKQKWSQILNQDTDYLTEEVVYALAQANELSMENVLLSPSVEHALLQIAQLFENQKVSHYIPNIAIYEEIAELSNILPVSYVLNTSEYKTPLVFIDNPNFPDGNLIYIDELERILEKNYHTTFCVNESLIQYAYGLTSSAKLVKHYKNLIVVGSYSKAYGLNSLDCAYILANKKWIKKTKERNIKTKINMPALLALKLILTEEDIEVAFSIQQVFEKKKKFARELSQLNGLSIFKSQTHFFLCELLIRNVSVFKRFLERKYDIKVYPEEKIEGLSKNYFGISLLSDKKNQLLFEAIKDFTRRA